MQHLLSRPICLLLLTAISILSSRGQNEISMSLSGATDTSKGLKTLPAGGPYDIVKCSMKDKAGNLWFGTTMYGIFRYDLLKGSFTNFTMKQGLNHHAVNAMMEDREGNIWCGTDAGVCLYDKHKGVFTHFKTPWTETDSTRNFYGPPPMNNVSKAFASSKGVVSILQDRAGNIWFGTLGSGVFRYTPSTGIYSKFLDSNGAKYQDGFYHNVIQSIIEDKAGNIWFASFSHGGVSSYDPVSGTFTHYTAKDGLTDDMIYKLIEDSRGNIWVGTRDHGTCRYDKDSGRFISFSWKDGLANNCVSSIFEDSKGTIWFGSDRGGISQYDYQTGVFTGFKVKEGIGNNRVWTILEDNSGHLWFGTREGILWRYEPLSGTFSSLTKRVE